MGDLKPSLLATISIAAALTLTAGGSASGHSSPAPVTEATDSESQILASASPTSSHTDLPPGGGQRLDEITVGGEPIETYYSDKGVEVGVAGLDPDKAPLTVHAAPTREATVVGELGPTDAVLLAGREWHHPALEDEGIWIEVQLADGYGWVEGNLNFFGATEGVTDDYINDVPPAEKEHVIAESVAIRAAEGDNDHPGHPGADWVMISSPEDFGEVFYRADVTGMPDDSLAGERLFIIVEEVPGGYQLAQVERTLICHRGVTDTGLCL